METLSLIAGAIGTVFGILSFQAKNQTRFLMAQIIANAGAAASFVLLGLDRLSGGLLCFAAIFQGIFNYIYMKKRKPIPRLSIVLFFLLYAAVTLIPALTGGTPRFPYSFCPFFSSILFLLSICAKKGKYNRLFGLLNGCVWLLYDFLGETLPWANLATHLFMICSSFLGLLRFDLLKKTRNAGNP